MLPGVIARRIGTKKSAKEVPQPTLSTLKMPQLEWAHVTIQTVHKVRETQEQSRHAEKRDKWWHEIQTKLQDEAFWKSTSDDLKEQWMCSSLFALHEE